MTADLSGLIEERPNVGVLLMRYMRGHQRSAKDLFRRRREGCRDRGEHCNGGQCGESKPHLIPHIRFACTKEFGASSV
jgi:hypothetical protein